MAPETYTPGSLLICAQALVAADDACACSCTCFQRLINVLLLPFFAEWQKSRHAFFCLLIGGIRGRVRALFVLLGGKLLF
jgi:hypothetical protein